MQKLFEKGNYPDILVAGEEYTDCAIKLIKHLEEELKIHIKYVEQLKGHFVKLCKIKNILEEK